MYFSLETTRGIAINRHRSVKGSSVSFPEGNIPAFCCCVVSSMIFSDCVWLWNFDDVE